MHVFHAVAMRIISYQKFLEKHPLVCTQTFALALLGFLLQPSAT